MRVEGASRAGWGRYDTPGATLYVAADPTSAYAEVLSSFKRAIGGRDPLEADAVALGLTREQFLEEVATEWQEQSFMGVGAIPSIWRHERGLFPVSAEGDGWWADVEHPDSLSALEVLASDVLIENGITSLTTAVLRGENRLVTTGIAATIRGLTLDGGDRARGIAYGSKHGGGTCQAIWLPSEADDWSAGLLALGPDPLLVSDENLVRAADRFRIRVF
ncbi:hypothetical protein B7R21_02680 [Subtercola boreus]|uniref:RES domain-containing protein n=1 Tax=Subtercola boreus TaxID=120213 RepID=A0A3E0W2T5_9MICO|nr:hypothetical protein B7R21_02680 [Subtercola boreus]